MTQSMFSLSDIPVYASCEIKEVKNGKLDKRRLFDLGFFEGSKVVPLYVGPGGITAYFVKGTVIALRKEDAKYIKAAICPKEAVL